MKLSDLKSRIKLVKRSIEINSNGFNIETYQEINEVWSKIEQVSISEKIISAEENMQDIKKFIIRISARPSIEINELYIKYNNKTYDVIGYETFNSLEDFIAIIGKEYIHGS